MSEGLPFDVRLFDHQVQALEIAGADLVVCRVGLRGAFDLQKDQKVAENTPITGSEVAFIAMISSLDELTGLLFRMAESLRKGNRVDLVPITYCSDYPKRKYLDKILYEIDAQNRNSGEKPRYNHIDFDNVVLQTLFSNRYPDGSFTETSPSLHRVRTVLDRGRRVRLCYEPGKPEPKEAIGMGSEAPKLPLLEKLSRRGFWGTLVRTVTSP